MTTQSNKKQAAPGIGPEAEARVDHKQRQSDYTPTPEDGKASFEEYLKTLPADMRAEGAF